MRAALIILLLGITMNLRASEAIIHYQAQFEEANEKFESEAYQDAIDLYAGIENADLQSEKLLYNLGNCYYKLGDLPSAIWYYERALKLAPADADILFNLALARIHTVDKIETIPPLAITTAFHTLIDTNSSNGWLSLFYLLWIGSMILITGLFLVQISGVKKLMFSASIVTATCGLVFLLFSFISKQNVLDSSYAIVFAPSVTAKSGPNPTTTDLFVIHEGTKVTLVSKDKDWQEIVLEDGKQGWISQSAIKKI